MSCAWPPGRLLRKLAVGRSPPPLPPGLEPQTQGSLRALWGGVAQLPPLRGQSPAPLPPYALLVPRRLFFPSGFG